jgi:polyhydroxybutyrate depolymerase
LLLLDLTPLVEESAKKALPSKREGTRTMRKTAVVELAMAAAIAASAVLARAACDGKPAEVGAVKLAVGAVQRMALVRVPADYDARRPRAVVLVFHGFTMTARLMESFVNVAEAWPEAIVVYPQGLNREFASWRVGSYPGWQISPGELGDRDLAFFDALIGWLRANHCVDEKRVFAMGFSNGGYFSHLLGCERPDAIAAIAPAAGGLRCSPWTARPVIISHGTADALVSYDEGVTAAQAWAKRNGCKAPPKSGTAGCSQAEACVKAPVTLCTNRMGHEYDESFTRAAVEFFKSRR